MLKGCLIAIAAAVVLFIAAVVVVFVLFSRQPDLSKTMKPVNVSAQAAQSFDDKVDGLEKALATAPPGTDLSMTITQQEATSKIDTLIETSSAQIPLKDVVLNFHDGFIEASATMNMGGGDRTLLVDATVQAEGNAVGVDVKSVKVGSLPVPPGFVEGFLPTFAPGIDLSHIPLPPDVALDVTDVTFQEGIAIVEVTAR